MVFKIAKHELSTLFFTPIAWLVLVIFAALLGIQYTDILDGIFDTIKSKNNPGPITVKLFEKGLYSNISDLLFLFIPILTMGLISREKSSGTIKLLYSSPLRIRSIIFGKFFGLLIYSFLFIVLILTVVYNARPLVPNFDTGTVISGLMAIFLLIAAYSAIGLFMSTLSTYQVISALVTMVFLKGLSLLSGLSETVPVLGNIINWLAVTEHSKGPIAGLLKSSDIIYFVVFTAMFLIFSILKLQSEGQNKADKKITLVKSVIVLLFAVGITYFFSVPSRTVYWDLTMNKKHSLAPYSQGICDSLDRKEPLKITTYGNIITNYQVRFSNQPKDRAEFNIYHKYIPNIKLEYIPYYDENLNTDEKQSTPPKLKGLSERDKAAIYAKYSRSSIEDVMNLEDIPCKDEIGEYGGFVRCIEYKDKKEYFKSNMTPSGNYERELVTIFKKFLVPVQNVVFIDGHNERKTRIEIQEIDLNSYSPDPAHGDLPEGWTTMFSSLNYRYSLRNSGFNVSIINLKEKEIPSETHVLVIGDPKIEFTTEEIQKIKDYIRIGGNLIIAGEPGSQSVINPIIKHLGVELSQGIIVKESKQNNNNSGSYNSAKNPTSFSAGTHPEGQTMIGTMVSSLKFSGATGLNIINKNSFKMTPLLCTNDQYWLDTEGPDENYQVYLNPEKGEKKGIITVVLALTRELKNKQQQIIIAGDADFLNNRNVIPPPNRGLPDNLLFCYDIFKWFTNGEYPFLLSKPLKNDGELIITNEKVSRLKQIFIWSIPGAIALLGFIILLRRRRL